MFKRLKEEMYLPLIFTLAMNTIAYNGSRIWSSWRHHADMTLEIDRMTPVLSWTILIYLGSFLFWAINYVIGAQQDREEAYHLLSADIAAKVVCLIAFSILPTTNVRPEIVNDGFFDWLLLLIYRIDAADNLFPSIHCLTSCFCFIAVRRNPKVPTWYKITSFLIAIAIYISTLTTKQHVLVDVISGVALAEISYYIVGKTGFPKWYAAKMKSLSGKINEKILSRVFKFQTTEQGEES